MYALCRQREVSVEVKAETTRSMEVKFELETSNNEPRIDMKKLLEEKAPQHDI
jgi:hypothetical protein